MLVSLWLVGVVVFVGLGTGVAASTVSTTVPVGSAVEEVLDSKLDTSARRRAFPRVTYQSTVGGGSDSTSGLVATAERLLLRVLRLAPPSWRGPPVLLI